MPLVCTVCPDCVVGTALASAATEEDTGTPGATELMGEAKPPRGKIAAMMDINAEGDSVVLVATGATQDVPPIPCRIAGDTAVPPDIVAG